MKPVAFNARYDVDVAVPYRLDLTVSMLRRLSANIVDVLYPTLWEGCVNAIAFQQVSLVAASSISQPCYADSVGSMSSP